MTSVELPMEAHRRLELQTVVALVLLRRDFQHHHHRLHRKEKARDLLTLNLCRKEKLVASAELPMEAHRRLELQTVVALVLLRRDFQHHHRRLHRKGVRTTAAIGLVLAGLRKALVKIHLGHLP